jgi:osmotically inducible lipoprotein OsmB
MNVSKWLSLAGALAFASALSACGTMDRQTIGTAGGAALGGIAGSEASDGDTAATVGGAVVGGVVGNAVTRP